VIYVDVDEATVRLKWRELNGSMDERLRRLWAGAEAEAIGWGGIAAVARATGMAISTVTLATRGDPESPLRWTNKSTHTLSAEMFERFQLRVGDKTVARLLRELGYSLQAPSKTVEYCLQVSKHSLV
jgi:hypothetical protein